MVTAVATDDPLTAEKVTLPSLADPV